MKRLRINGQDQNNNEDSAKQQNTSESSEVKIRKMPKEKRVGGCGCGKSLK